MKKMRLDVDALAVESFGTAQRSEGGVRSHQDGLFDSATCSENVKCAVGEQADAPSWKTCYGQATCVTFCELCRWE